MTTREARTEAMEELWSEYQICRDHRLREQLIEFYRPVALSVLKHVGYRADEDLEQVAMLGLVKAVDRFDPAVGFRFSTFAVPTIMGEIKRHLRDHSRMVRPPRWLFDLHTAVVAKECELSSATGQVPTLAQVAAALEIDVERVVEAMAMEENCHPQSLDGLTRPVERERLLLLEECLGADDPELARVEARVAWDQVLAQLAPPLREVIELRYFQGLTQKEAAQQLGVSQMQVSRLEHRALDRLRGRAAQIIRAIEELPPPTGLQRSAHPRQENGLERRAKRRE